MIVQFCGMSGAGKSTLARMAEQKLRAAGCPVEVLDGDECRRYLFKELGMSLEDRAENIRRLAWLAHRFSRHGILTIICAINPLDAIRQEIAREFRIAATIQIDCALEELIRRDTKGLYKRAFLPDGHPEKIYSLSGVNGVFEYPLTPDLLIHTDRESEAVSGQRLYEFLLPLAVGMVVR